MGGVLLCMGGDGEEIDIAREWAGMGVMRRGGEAGPIQARSGRQSGPGGVERQGKGEARVYAGEDVDVEGDYHQPAGQTRSHLPGLGRAGRSGDRVV
ncbi:hypothetical protein ACLK2D_14085 [Escherichia coli]